MKTVSDGLGCIRLITPRNGILYSEYRPDGYYWSRNMEDWHGPFEKRAHAEDAAKGIKPKVKRPRVFLK